MARRPARPHPILAVDDPARRLRQDARRARRARRLRGTPPRVPSASHLAARRGAAGRPRVQFPVRDPRVLADVRDRRAGAEADASRASSRTRSPSAPDFNAGDEIERDRRRADADVGERDAAHSRRAARRRPDRSHGTRAERRDARRRARRARPRAGAHRARPCCSEGLGLRPGPAAVVGAVVEDSPAERAGLRAGDRVIRGDGAADRGLGAVGRVPAEPARRDRRAHGAARRARACRHGDARERHRGRHDVRPHRRERARVLRRAALRRPRGVAARRREDLGSDDVHRVDGRAHGHGRCVAEEHVRARCRSPTSQAAAPTPGSPYS